jgi:hypothetical protein
MALPIIGGARYPKSRGVAAVSPNTHGREARSGSAGRIENAIASVGELVERYTIHTLGIVRIAVHTSATTRLTVHACVALRTGNKEAVLAESNAALQLGFRNMDHFHELLRACVNHAPEAELSKAVAQLETDPVSQRDAELLYQNAETLGFCGQPDAALRQLRKAIQGNYCSYPAMEKDPQFDLIRHRTEFAELQQAGLKCQQSFQSHRQRLATALPGKF